MALAEQALKDPQALHRDWEEGQWNRFSIDLSEDARQWAALDQADRELVYWGLSSLWAALGTTAEEVRKFAVGGLSRRLGLIGVPLESL